MSESGGGPSNFGCFRSGVGSKAGGFIAKKFFHPSSIRNQEKVWKNMEKAKELEAAELERQKRRDEERQVDELRKQMHARGQTKREDDLLKRTVQTKVATGEEATLQAEHKKRLVALRKLDEQDAVAAAPISHKSAVSSKYKEDVTHDGHVAVWGSLYDPTTEKWGYKCCATFDQHAACPNAAQEESTSKKRKKQKAPKVDDGDAAVDAQPSPLTHPASSSCSGAPPPSDTAPAVTRESTSHMTRAERMQHLANQRAEQQPPPRSLPDGVPGTTDGAQSRAQYMDALFQDPCV
eukprot:GEMP01073708.1.p1 GENE.GEMP01073708.1~~GEMP01073708.1.p1  ORF type:complete len:293 (+),score=90.83 GEMP01073708.1:77-955(+)